MVSGNHTSVVSPGSDEQPPPPSKSTLSIVTDNGIIASASSISPLVGATIDRQALSPQSQPPDRISADEMGQQLDFIGTTDAVKKIFSMSLDATSSSMQQQKHQDNQRKNRKPTLLAVHNFNGTLLLDNAIDESDFDTSHSNDHGSNLDNNWRNFDRDETISDTRQSTATILPPSSQSLALALSPATQSNFGADHRDSKALSSNPLTIISNIVQSGTITANIDDETNLSTKQPRLEGQNQSSAPVPSKTPREYIPWKFQNLNMLLGHDALIFRPPQTSKTTTATSPEGDGIAIRVEDARFLRSVWEAFQRQQAQQKIQSGSSTFTNTRSYAQALIQDREQELSLPVLSEIQEPPISHSAVVQVTKATENSQDYVAIPKESETTRTTDDISEVPLQSCIVPYPGPLGSKISPSDSSSPLSLPSDPATRSTPAVFPAMDSPALSIVLDAYLDNLMANVPQLALCLEEKGLIQSVKMLPTEEIPHRMLHPSTLDTSRPLDVLPSQNSSNNGGTSRTSTTPVQNQNVHRHHRRTNSSSKLEEAIFSPQIMEMNASALLRFLKTNCTRNHATYLLRYDGLDEIAEGDGNGRPQSQNIQLYDISSISTQKQKKWIWWLATMSYRFALRLRHLETTTSSDASFPENVLSESQKRAIRDRQRSLFQQTLDLLQDLMDIDGNAHESMVASVREHMADTYLNSITASSRDGDFGTETTASVRRADSKSFSPRKQSISDLSPSPSPPVVTATISAAASTGPISPSFSHNPQLPNSDHVPATPCFDSKHDLESHYRQPYSAVSVDALNKAQDHLERGIKTLSSLVEKDIEERRIDREAKILVEKAASKRSRRRQRAQKLTHEESKDSKSKGQEEKDDHGRIPRLSPGIVLQLFEMNFKLVNISLRLAEHHLGNYYSSSAMQALRTAARHLNDAVNLLDHYNSGTMESSKAQHDRSEENKKRQESLQIQYIWLLEHCGHFARSFASDNLWRDRGHASGEDVITVLSDVEVAFTADRKVIVGPDEDEVSDNIESRFWKMIRIDVLRKISQNQVSLQSPSGIVAPNINSSQTKVAIEAAKVVLGKENVLRRERRKVLVCCCISYSRAISAFQFTAQIPDTAANLKEKTVLLNLLYQRLGDACNETGKVLLDSLRTLLINNQGSKRSNESQLAAEALLDSAEFWFTRGLEAFDACKDTRNLALLRCNICQSFKLRANSGFSKRHGSSSSSKHAEDCLQQAADQLVTAHEDLGQRDVDPHTWDMVSEQLAATFLVLGVRRRQSLLGSGNAPVIFQNMRLSPGQERSIVDPMERALKIYEQSDNAHQGAATHYQLALTYSKLWTCQLNETNTRKKLSKAFEHYSSAFTYFSSHSRGNEPTFCLLCLDLASLYAAIPGEEGLIKSLGCCLDCCDTFSLEAIQLSMSLPTPSMEKSKSDWYDKMETIAHSIDDRVFKLLKSLVKINSDRYKVIYREGLTAKMVRNVPDIEHEELDLNPKASTLLALHEVLLAIKKLYGVIVSKG